VHRGRLVRRRALSGRLGAQPQADVGRLHGLPYHANHRVAQTAEVALLFELGGVGIEDPYRVVLPGVEAPIYQLLYPATQQAEQGRGRQGGGNDSESGLLAAEGAQGSQQAGYAPGLHRRQRDRHRRVDEGAVDD